MFGGLNLYDALYKQDKIKQDIDFLDAQLSMEYGWDTDVDDNVN